MADRALKESYDGPERMHVNAKRPFQRDAATSKVRAIDPVDQEIGGRVRARRIALGMSQKRLAMLVGVRFQQVQKYESGANRIAASRLLDVSRALRTPVEHFYEDLQPTPERAASDLIGRVQSIPETSALLTLFATIPAPTVRRKLLSLARAIAEAAGAEDSPAHEEDAPARRKYCTTMS